MIRVVSTLDEFSGLSERWNGLLTRTAANSIFLTWEWHYTWARTYLENNRLFVLLVYENDEMVGIAPLYVRKTTSYPLVGLRQVEFLGTGEACPSYLDFIVVEHARRKVLRTIYEFLHGEARRSWDVLYLEGISADSLSIDILYETTHREGKLIEIADQSSCPFIRLTGTVEDFLRGISSNERYNLRRKKKRLAEVGHVEYYRVSSREELGKELDAFVRLHQMRWEQQGAAGCFASRRFLKFHRELSVVLGKKGWMHLDFLVLSGEKVAAIYGYSYGDRYYFYLPGLNPGTCPEASPGILMLFQCVCEAIQDGHKVFDLLRGVDSYKLAWASGVYRCVTLKHYNRGIRPATSKLLESGKAVVKVLVR